MNKKVIGIIKRDSIDCPSDAMFAMKGPTGLIIKWYRVVNVKFNDNTTQSQLEYLSERGIWMRSNFNVSTKFVELYKII
jgi:hypothetical protein